MIHINDLPRRELFPGFAGRFVHGEKSTWAFWDVKKGSSAPLHQHPHEQITYVLEGELEMMIGGEKMLFTPGTAYVIPGNTPHSAFATTDCQVMDVFAPVREEYK